MDKRIVILSLLSCMSFSSCKLNSKVNNGNFLQGYDGTEDKFNTSIFYKNIGQIQAADPHVIMHDGVYYLYATNANGNADCSYLQCWSSKNLSNWTCEGIAYQPDLKHWCIDGLWAPECIEKDGKFYLYYSGWHLKRGGHQIGVAISNSPKGPFVDFTGTNDNGDDITESTETIHFDFPVIDASPFIDNDGEAYLLFTADQIGGISTSYIAKLNDDMVSIDYSSVTQVCTPDQKWETSTPGSTSYWNEGPHMINRNGKYYLFYSANYYQDREYAVGVATSDSPFGPFVKYDEPVLSAKNEWDYTSGTGHCSIFKSADGSEYFITYHSHKDTILGGSERVINFDRLNFVDDKVYVNGPSISPQPLPSGSSKYKNIANDGVIKVNGARVNKLNDSIINTNSDDLSYELDTQNNNISLTIEFENARKIKAVMLYDSVNYKYALRKVNELIINDKMVEDWKISSKYLDTDFYEFKTPLSSFNYEFDELETNLITINITNNENIYLNELVVLGL